MTRDMWILPAVRAVTARNPRGTLREPSASLDARRARRRWRMLHRATAGRIVPEAPSTEGCVASSHPDRQRAAAFRAGRVRGAYRTAAIGTPEVLLPDDVTAILRDARTGDRHAVDRLFPLVYDELRGVARNRLAVERSDHTLDTTALVHEAYIRLVDQTRVDWQDRAHFFAVAARAMRRVLLDHARRHATEKRGGGLRRIALDADAMSIPDRGELLLDLDGALEQLERLDARLARVVECRFFGGLTEEETAAALGTTARTVRRDWVKARGLLYDILSPDAPA